MSYYGNEMKDFKFVPVSKKKEKALFKRFYAFKPPYSAPGKQITKNEQDAIAAREEIVKLYLLLVVKLSITFSKGIIPEDDAISAGNFALMQALESRRFDPKKGFRFSSYLRLYIHGEIMEALNEYQPLNGWHGDEDNETTNQPGIDPIWAEERFVDNSFERRQLNEERHNLIMKYLNKMTPTQKAAVIGVGMEGKTFKVVGKEIGRTRQAVQQAYWRALPKLRAIFSLPKNQELSI
jgi:RNA polymerase sigma factor (sigma-70 family)